MAEAGGAKVRTVADVMSHRSSPRRRRRPSPTPPAACASSASARSSSSTASAPIGILTERDLVRLAAAGADAVDRQGVASG